MCILYVSCFIGATNPEILYLNPDGDGDFFICESSSPTWTVNRATVTVTVTVDGNKFDGHDEVSISDKSNMKVLKFNKCINNTEYGCDDDDKDFHGSAIVYCKGLFLCDSFELCMCIKA